MEQLDVADKKFLVSIVLPVFNASGTVERCLNSLVAQIKAEDLQVEILVCDDVSSDATNLLVQNYQRQFNFIKLYPNQAHLGFNRSLDKMFSLGQGQFYWVLHQDEIVSEGGVKKVINIIKANSSVPYLCLSSHPFLPLSKDAKYCRDGNDWLGDGLSGGDLAHIFNRDFLPANREKYYQSMWFCLALALEVIASRPSIWARVSLIRSLRGKKDLADGQGFYRFVALQKLVSGLHHLGYSTQVISLQRKIFAHDLPRVTASARLHGLKLRGGVFFKIIKIFFQYPLHMIVASFVLILPVSLLKVLRPWFKQNKSQTLV